MAEAARVAGDIDFLLARRKYTLSMLEIAEEKQLLSGKFTVKVLKIEDQIGLKVQASSNDPERLHRDLADIELPMRQKYLQLNMDIVKEYFELFGRANELDKIVKGIKNAE